MTSENYISYSDVNCCVMAAINLDAFDDNQRIFQLTDKIDEITEILVKKGARGYAKIVVCPFVFEYLRKNFGRDLIENEPFDIISAFPDTYNETTVGVLGGKWTVNVLPSLRHLDIYHMFICVGTSKPENTACVSLLGLKNTYE